MAKNYQEMELWEAVLELALFMFYSLIKSHLALLVNELATA